MNILREMDHPQYNPLWFYVGVIIVSTKYFITIIMPTAVFT